jgi:ribosomal protein S18 acetylase RimI-like enzyme
MRASRRPNLQWPGAPPDRPDALVTVRPAEQRDLGDLQAIEAAADQTFVPVFGPLDWGEPATGRWRARQPGFLLVAEQEAGDGQSVAGFAHVLWLEGTAHLEQLAVHPDHHRRGHGSALLHAAMDRAREGGYTELTLSTYAEVPWNAPFYRRHGFEVIERPGPLLQRLQEKEERMGLMRYGPRVVMRVALG